MSKAILELPNEILIKILTGLDLIDLVRCRLISKKFRDLVDNVEKNELIILNDHLSCIEMCFSHPFFSLFNFKNSFQPPEHFDFLSTSLFQSLFKNLKALYLFSDLMCAPAFELIKQFRNLESLNLGLYMFAADEVIDFPFLKEFTLIGNHSRWIHPTGEKVTVKSKSLERIFVRCCYNKFVFEDPVNIQHVEFYDSDCAPLNISNFEKLKNLKFRTNSFYGIGLDEIKNFKELELLFIKGKLDSNAKAVINELLDLKSRNLNKIKKIFHHKIEIVKQIDNDYKYSDGGFECVDYSSLSRSLSTIGICFDDLNKLLDHLDDLDRDEMIPRLPSCFFEKFSEIRSVNVLRLEDEEELLNFLRKCKYLFRLGIKESKFRLSQNFVNQLPSICANSMYKLSLGKLTDRALDYEAISQLRYLGDLVIKCEADAAFAVGMFKRCRNLLHITIYHLGSPLTIVKERKQLFTIKEKSYLIKQFDFNKEYNKKISIKLIKDNFDKHQMYSLLYFNRKLSRFGSSYEQLEEYLQTIDKLHERELKKNKKLEVVDRDD